MCLYVLWRRKMWIIGDFRHATTALNARVFYIQPSVKISQIGIRLYIIMWCVFMNQDRFWSHKLRLLHNNLHKVNTSPKISILFVLLENKSSYSINTGSNHKHLHKNLNNSILYLTLSDGFLFGLEALMKHDLKHILDLFTWNIYEYFSSIV